MQNITIFDSTSLMWIYCIDYWSSSKGIPSPTHIPRYVARSETNVETEKKKKKQKQSNFHMPKNAISLVGTGQVRRRQKKISLL